MDVVTDMRVKIKEEFNRFAWRDMEQDKDGMQEFYVTADKMRTDFEDMYDGRLIKTAYDNDFKGSRRRKG